VCKWLNPTTADLARDRTVPRYRALLSSPVGTQVEERHNGRLWRFRVVSNRTDPNFTRFAKDVRGWVCQPTTVARECAIQAARAERLKAWIRATRMTLAGFVEGGATHCDPSTGQPVVNIDRTQVPECMWPCAERHEQAHADFLRPACERVADPLRRADFWQRMAKKYGDEGDTENATRAVQEMTRAVNEAVRQTRWFDAWFDQTCRVNEGQAYQVTVEECDKPEIRRRCAAAKKATLLRRNMEQWRKWVRDPPDCKPVRPGPIPY
jgi:hypothetical protein